MHDVYGRGVQAQFGERAHRTRVAFEHGARSHAANANVVATDGADVREPAGVSGACVCVVIYDL